MGKNDDKGEPVKTVTIGGKKVEVPIIFVLPEESGEKEIERYEHPKVHIESKKIAPLLGAGAGITGGIATAGKKIGEDVSETATSAPDAISEGAKLSPLSTSESDEEPLDKLTHGKLEEVEKLPFPVPKEESEAMIAGTVPKSWEDSNRNERDKQPRNVDSPLGDLGKGYSDDFKEGGFSQQQAPEEEEDDTPYFELLSDKPKKKKKKVKVGYKDLMSSDKGKKKKPRKGKIIDDDFWIDAGLMTPDYQDTEKSLWKSWLQKRDDWDEEERDMTNAYFGRKKKKKKRSSMEDLGIEVDDSDPSGIDKLKALQLEIKDALKPEKNQGEMSTAEFGGRSGRNPKTGRELNDYLESQEPYGFGKLGKKEPQTSRGQADDATQERAMNYYSAKDPRSGRDSALKKPAREAGENTVRGDARVDQHEPKSHETASSGNDWKSSNRVGRELYDQEPLSELKEEDYEDGKLMHHKIREVPPTGKAPTEGKQPLGRKAGFTGNEKLIRQMAGYPPSYFEDTYDAEEERRRTAKLPKTGKKPKGTTRKKAWETWLDKNFIFSGKIDPKTGKKKKIKFKEQYDLDDFETEKEHET